MKIIEQSHEILHIDGIDRIERAARTCYKSEEKIGCRCPSRAEFHGCPNAFPYCEPDEENCAHCAEHSSARMIRQLIKRGHHAMLEHGSATVRFITNRGVTHELVRHRMASFGQESTRFVSYGGKGIEFIRPVWCDKDSRQAFGEWQVQMQIAEDSYNHLLELGWRPEQAREVLPNALKTEIVVTANYREWMWIFQLRAIGTTGRPHPQMQALMIPLLEEFKSRVPAVFDDLEVNNA